MKGYGECKGNCENKDKGKRQARGKGPGDKGKGKVSQRGKKGSKSAGKGNKQDLSWAWARQRRLLKAEDCEAARTNNSAGVSARMPKSTN